MKYVSDHKKSGFTLIELAVVITIMGLLVGNGLALVSAINDSAKEDLTERRLEFITDAIDQFVDYYGYLPCPANPTETIHALGGDDDFGFGEVSVTSGTGPTDSAGTDATCTTDNIITGTGVYVGTLPVYTLNIHPSYAFDGWNNRFMYVVDSRVIFRGDAQDQTVGAKFERGTVDNGTVSIGYASGNADGASNDADLDGGGLDNDDTRGTIQIFNATGTTAGVSNAVVLVHSAGKNGLSAWPGRGGARLGSTGITTAEEENTDNDNQFRHGFLSPDIDDHLTFLTKWQIDTAITVNTSSPGSLPSKDYLITTSNDGDAHKVLQSDGSIVWTFTTGGSAEDAAIDSSGNVYIAAGYDGIYKLDPDGNELWHNTDGGFQESVVWHPDGHVYTGDKTDELRKLSDSDGSEIWAHNFADSVQNVEIDGDGYLIIAGDSSLGVAKMDTNRNIQWQVIIGQDIFDLAIDSNNDIYLAGRSGDVIKLDGTNGNELWRENISTYNTWGVVVSNDDSDVFVTNINNIYQLDASTGTQVTNLNIGISALQGLGIDANGDLYTHGWNGDVAKVAPTLSGAGDIIWQQTPHSQPGDKIEVAR